ncbi:MAG: NAD-dependent epimerase/dehydratase family protein [Clostridiales bacterium]|jgi:nucleoside-diphosphate-sugar epimerase|nr:NAD-dependent epimerase/dehydratase family protein [Clostridiales bacterium]
MKALFIGGTGIISADAVKAALAKGWDVTVLNRGLSSRSQPGGEAALPEGAMAIECDARDESSMRRVMSGKRYDVVANFIGYLPEQVEQDVRVFGGICGQYIFVSTCAVYDKPGASYLATESTPLRNANSVYASRKIACEEALNRAFRERDFPVTIVRPNWTYCKGTLPFIATPWRQPWTLIHRLKRGLPILMPGDGTGRFAITHSRDFAEGFAGLMGNAAALGHAFHIAGDEALSWNQYLAIIERATGYEADVVNVATSFICKVVPEWHDDLIGDKTANFALDNAKIKGCVPGFAARTTYAAGARETIEYLATRLELQVVDEEYMARYDRVFDAYRPCM